MTLLEILVVIAALASGPIETRLWRAGRLSDRTLALLIVGRPPAVVCLLALLGGLTIGVALLVVSASLVPSLLLYRFVLGIVRARAGQSPSP